MCNHGLLIQVLVPFYQEVACMCLNLIPSTSLPSKAFLLQRTYNDNNVKLILSHLFFFLIFLNRMDHATVCSIMQPWEETVYVLLFHMQIIQFSLNVLLIIHRFLEYVFYVPCFAVIVENSTGANYLMLKLSLFYGEEKKSSLYFSVLISLLECWFTYGGINWIQQTNQPFFFAA